MKLKNFFSFFDYTLQTKSSTKEVCKKLIDNTEPEKNFSTFRYTPTTKLYRGEINNDSFSLKKVIVNKGSLPLVVKGNISNNLGKTEVELNIRPVTTALIFILVWLTFVGFVCLFILYALFFGKHTGKITTASAPLLVPFAMFLIGLLIVRFAFGREAKRMKNALAEILDAEDENDRG